MTAEETVAEIEQIATEIHTLRSREPSEARSPLRDAQQQLKSGAERLQEARYVLEGRYIAGAARATATVNEVRNEATATVQRTATQLREQIRSEKNRASERIRSDENSASERMRADRAANRARVRSVAVVVVMCTPMLLFFLYARLVIPNELFGPTIGIMMPWAFCVAVSAEAFLGALYRDLARESGPSVLLATICTLIVVVATPLIAFLWPFFLWHALRFFMKGFPDENSTPAA